MEWCGACSGLRFTDHVCVGLQATCAACNEQFEGIHFCTGNKLTSVYSRRDNEPESLNEIIFNRLACIEPLTKEYIGFVLEDIVLFDGKHHDYGPGNHSM